MSAYGSLPPVTHPKPILAPRLYEVRRKDRNESQITTNSSEWTHISVHHLTLARAPPALVGLMHEEFGAELERDETRTYPQEAGMTRADFESYYFARDVFVGIGHAFDSYSQSQLQSRLEEYNNNQSDDKYIKEENKEVDKDGLEGNNAVIMDLLESARAGRDWKDAIAGFYYVSGIFITSQQ